MFANGSPQWPCAFYASNSLSNAVHRGLPYIMSKVYYAYFFSRKDLGNAYLVEQGN
jgi:hypothetical protein